MDQKVGKQKINSGKLWAEILFKFQWQIEKLCPEIGFGPGFVSISPFNNIKNGIDQAAKSYQIIKYKKKILKHCQLEKSGIYNKFLAKKD